MKLNIWLYNSSYTIVSSQYVVFDEVPKLIDYLEKITENNDYTYRIENGDNSRARPFGKYNPPVLYRCMSCGAAIRKDDKYHLLHIKGQKYIFCKLCVELSDHIAYEREGFK